MKGEPAFAGIILRKQGAKRRKTRHKACLSAQGIDIRRLSENPAGRD
ncbi:MAG: hypothetical protein JRD02_01665 [Deltaproteobacteria bacterium]|nr:hypothetical protein [Deltaproteobacteria bacterium]